MKFVAFLLLLGAIIVYWKVALAIVVVVAVVKAAPIAYREISSERMAERARLRGLISRADHQHAQWVSGDTRGMYGAYPPANA